MSMETDFVEEFFSSTGRFLILSRFVSLYGPSRISSMSDDDLKSMWSDEVQSDLERFELNQGDLVGLGSRVLGSDLEPFHQGDDLGRHWYLTASGIQMLRWLSARLPPLQPTEDKANIRSGIQSLARIVETSNELGADQKRDLLGYLAAANAILDQPNTDRRLLFELLQAVQRYAGRIGVKFLEAEAQELLRWLLDHLPF